MCPKHVQNESERISFQSSDVIGHEKSLHSPSGGSTTLVESLFVVGGHMGCRIDHFERMSESHWLTWDPSHGCQLKQKRILNHV